ncbi:MAG TPA: PilZ domain-containing protein [Candidatus Methylomirabilis sp.]|nr:PilZ domain-containing protein [Candidatus Methylomirabilis sp.]
MGAYKKERKVPRIVIPGHPAARARATLEVSLCDLSVQGARIEHLSLLRPGSHCTLELPPPFTPLALSAEIVWSKVVGTEEGTDRQPRLRYQSGIAFTGLTAEQQVALAKALERIIPEGGLGLGRLALG